MGLYGAGATTLVEIARSATRLRPPFQKVGQNRKTGVNYSEAGPLHVKAEVPDAGMVKVMQTPGLRTPESAKTEPEASNFNPRAAGSSPTWPARQW